MDPLSEVLSLLKPRSYVSSGFEAGDVWALRFAEHFGAIKCYAIVAGECWLAVEGDEAPTALRAGDCFLLASGRSFRLASDLDLPPHDANAVFASVRRGDVAVHNGGGRFRLIGSRFDLIDQAGLLLGALPPVIHIRGDAERTTLRWSVERMMAEMRDPQPGGTLMTEHLAHMMLIQALRLYLMDGSKQRVGWLYALADQQVRRAIGVMHADPGQRWTLRSLAGTVGMSRTAFAQRFRAVVGTTPLEYLTRWRMIVAQDRLASGETVSGAAQALGYESESAFSTAFKRVMGFPPRHCRQPSQFTLRRRSTRASGTRPTAPPPSA